MKNSLKNRLLTAVLWVLVVFAIAELKLISLPIEVVALCFLMLDLGKIHFFPQKNTADLKAEILNSVDDYQLAVESCGLSFVRVKLSGNTVKLFVQGVTDLSINIIGDLRKIRKLKALIDHRKPSGTEVIVGFKGHGQDGFTTHYMSQIMTHSFDTISYSTADYNLKDSTFNDRFNQLMFWMFISLTMIIVFKDYHVLFVAIAIAFYKLTDFKIELS